MAGLEIGPHGGIAVDADGRTSDAGRLRSGRRRGEGRRPRRPVLAHRPGQHRQPAGPPGGRPDLRPAGASRALAGHGHREGVRAHRGHDRVEREAAAGVRALLSRHPLAPHEPRRLLPGRRADVAQAALRSRDRPHRRRPGRRRVGVDKRIDVLATAMAARLRGRRAGRPRARLRAAVLVGQGPGEHARLHGREPHVRSVRRGRARRGGRDRVRAAGPCSTCAPRPSTPPAPSPAA